MGLVISAVPDAGEDLLGRVARLVAVFGDILETRMTGLPLVNPVLKVEAVGFRAVDGGWLGVLIAPWFMNLVRLSAPGDPLAALGPGIQVDLDLPAGRMRFTVGGEDRVGPFQTCSLFSPMTAFADQEAARLAAGAAMDAAMTPVQPPPAAEPTRREALGRLLGRPGSDSRG